ncbi:hypothetical protein BGX20_008598 [Mortierella sp. AD010]|nr:hypothetical protein BGX20_008598 [Mortierella sp. AD010]
MSLAYTQERADELVENLTNVRVSMEQVLQSKDSAAQEARLVAVSKLKPASDILAVYEKAGHRHFGENYVQELEGKSKELPGDIQWHFIGSLQSNKCKVVAAIPNLFVVETVDSAKKATTLDKACAAAARPEPLPKSGMQPTEALEVAQHVVSTCSHLKLAGLMTIGSPNPDLENGDNPDFKLLGQCKSTVEEALNIRDLELSMGNNDESVNANADDNNTDDGNDDDGNGTDDGSTIFGARPPFQKTGA